MQHSAASSTCLKFLTRILPPLLIATLIFMAAFAYVMLRETRSEIDRDVAMFADSLTPVLDDLLWNFQQEELSSALATLSSNPAMRRAEIFDSNNDLFVAYGDPPDRDARTVEAPILRQLSDGTARRLGRLVVHYDYSKAETMFMAHFIGQVIRLLIIIMVMLVSGYFAYQRVIGRPLGLLLNGIRETDSEGKPGMVQWDGNDEISEIIHAHNRMAKHLSDKESALAESEQRYRQLFDNAMIGIFETSKEGNIRNANATVADILAYPSVDALLEVDLERHYVDPKDRLKLWEILLTKGRVTNYRVQLRRADNVVIWAELSGKLNPDSSFNATLEDVTAQRAAQQAVVERDELHRAFFEENNAVMLLHDPMDLTIQFVNPAACLFYGYSEAELTSMTIRDLNSMDDAEIFEELKHAADEKRGYFKQVHTLKSGTRRDVEVFTGPVSIGRRQLHYSIVHDVTEKRRMEARLERMATRDQLTGTYNRHAFFEKGKKEIARAQRYGHPLSLLMLDLDKFKNVNDAHGHAVGDEVLRVFALRCRAGLRETDIFARLGGEEFAALLVETDEEMAVAVAERMRRTAADEPIITEAGEMAVTISIGVAALKDKEGMAIFLQRADKGLYEAKAAGRNCVRKN
jgi:diguanylate cyclase (GGDEF)-like protein/PAS domain S-box-containing protein